MFELVERRSAVFSECGFYRYQLERVLAPSGKIVAACGVNPSIAGADDEDQSTRKMNGFGVRNGVARYIFFNPFAMVATDVGDLALEADPVGPDNARHVNEVIARADEIWPCWGNRKKLPRRLWPVLDAMKQRLRTCGKPLRIFGLTKSGDPTHPLMLPYSTQLVPWDAL